MNSTQLNSTQLNSTQLNSTQLNKNWFKLLIIVISCFYFSNAFSQTQPILLNWTGQVGCIVYNENGDPKEPREGIFFEEISNDVCLRFCENNTATYNLTNLPTGSTVNWIVNGGTTIYVSPNTYSAVITWGAFGNGSLQIAITSNSNTITKTLCIEKIISPTALFAVNNITTPQGEINYLCSNQLLYFTNQSTTNNGTGIVSYIWDFGDGTSSNLENPTHTYTNQQHYNVSLTVFNSCSCPSTYEMTINTNGVGFDISCPSVVCENQTEIYSLPFDGQEICKDNFNWTVAGGTIVSEGGGNIAVNWDNVDATGFGYITFDPSGCELECSQPTTIKIPVILQNGTISGNTSLCIGEQQRYSLPQWPTTEIEWSIVGDPSELNANIIQTDQRNEIILTGLQPGPIVLRAVYKNTLLNCGGTAEIEIIIGESADIIGEELVCVSNLSYLYTFGNSSGVNTVFQLYTDNNVLLLSTGSPFFNYTFTTPGNYYIVAKEDAICQTKKNIKAVSNPAAPTGINGVDELCPNIVDTFSIQNPLPNSVYVWSITNGTINGSNVGTTISASCNGIAPAVLSVYRQTINPVSCSSSTISKTINITSINAEVSNNNTTVCANTISSYQVNVPGTNTLFNDPDVTYEWSLSNPLLGSISSGQGTNQISVAWNNVQQATCIILVSIKKCTVPVVFQSTVTINPIPTISIQTNATSICAGSPVSFSIVSSLPLPANTPVIWNFAGTTVIGTLNNQYYFFSNNDLIPIDYPVTAQIISPSGCVGTATNIASLNITVKPQPSAILSLTSSANAFCAPSDINASVTIASSTNGISSIQWFHELNGVVTAINNTNNVLQINGSPSGYGFGSYYFITTNTNGCTKQSNKINIIQDCIEPVFCNPTKPLSITNNSIYNPCGAVDLIGTVTGVHISSSWVIYGPTTAILNGNATTFNVVPGFYQIFHQVFYLCNGQVTKKTAKVDVLVPYEANFAYSATCLNNSSFVVSFTDTSTFFNPVNNRQVNYFYESPTGSNNWLPLAATGNPLPQGNYTFKVVITGSYLNTPQPPCEKIISNVSLQTIGNLSILYQPNPVTCHDTPVQFNVSGIPNPTFSYFWTFNNSAFSPSDVEIVSNTMVSPFRVFKNSGNHTVSVTVTNPSGCSITLNPIVVAIPNPCFVGAITSSISPAKACVGQSITLSYNSALDAGCSGITYQWMKGFEPFATTPTITVVDNGLYWLKLKSVDNCNYETNRIAVEFSQPPSIEIKGNDLFCEGDTVELEAITTANNIQWYIDNATTPLVSLNNQTTASLLGLSVGSHTIKVVVWNTNSTCTNTLLFPITINPIPAAVTISIQGITCNPYIVTLAASVPGVSNATFNWSNGSSGSTTSIANGGAIKVTATVNGCSVSSQVFVPKNPESYLWVFPSGCYDGCEEIKPTIIGPTIPFEYWNYNFNEQPISEGFADFVTPIFISNTGTYDLTLNNSFCQATAPPLTFSTNNCNTCRIDIKEKTRVVANLTPFCSYSFTLEISSYMPINYQATLSEGDNLIFVPATFTLLPGNNTYDFTIIPLNNFNGGTVNITLQGSYVDFETGELITCLYNFELLVPSCDGSKTASTTQNKESGFATDKNRVTLFPNPAQNQATLRYQLLENNAVMYLYDLSGRAISSQKITNTNGEILLDTSTLQPGIYIVVLKQNNLITNQQKLLKK